MIYTASYFHPEHHHGKLISISRSNPKAFARIPKFDFFSPSKELLNWWKESAQTETDWGNYRDRFFEETIDANFLAINQWFGQSQSHHLDITLLCWEHPGEHCHRNDVGKLIANCLPQLWGGFDVPPTKIEQMAAECQKKGLAVKCDRLSFAVDNDGFSLYQIWLGKRSLGEWSETGATNILNQLLKPTNSTKWLKRVGIEA